MSHHAFWSYTHDDNDRSGGRVLALADSVRNEFALSTADELSLFIDRRDIAWGDAWRDRVDGALGQVPLFIAVVTPKFLKSEECRRELIRFSSAATSRNQGRLLLPILYIPVDGLSDDSDDEVRAIIARTQYVDWTNLRLKDPQSPEVLQAINALALRIRDLQVEAVATTIAEEAKSPAQTNTELARTITEIDSRLDQWMESVQFDAVAARHWASTIEERTARVQRLLDGRQPHGTIVATYIQLGRELLPIARDRLEKAKNYARYTIELDPLVDAAMRLVSVHPDLMPRLGRLRDGIAEATRNIEDGISRAVPPWLVTENSHLREADDLGEESDIFVTEGNLIVLGWRERLRALDAQVESDFRG